MNYKPLGVTGKRFRMLHFFGTRIWASGEGGSCLCSVGGLADDYRILVNGTRKPNTLLNSSGTLLLPRDRRIDLIVTTHVDDGNSSPLNALPERFAVWQVMEPLTPERGWAIKNSGGWSRRMGHTFVEKSIKLRQNGYQTMTLAFR